MTASKRLKQILFVGNVSIASILASIVLSASMMPALASSQFSMAKKQILSGNHVVSTPYALVSGGTTYMPLWYVMQALKQMGVQNAWDGKNWYIQIDNFHYHGAAVGKGSIPVYVNGKPIYLMTKITTIDPASNQPTTFIPIYAIMQVLKSAGIQNTWDGTHWVVNSIPQSSTSSSTPGNSTQTTPNNSSPASSGAVSVNSQIMTQSEPATPVLTVANSIGTRVQNQAAEDSSYWNRSGSDLYIYAMSYNPTQATEGTIPLKSIQPGQSVYLLVYSNKMNVSNVTWSVNSPDGQVTPGDAGYLWSMEQHQAMEFKFKAQKPGIYTLQAKSNGVYSTPLVLTIGLNQLSGTLLTSLAGNSGILPLPSNLPNVSWSTGSWPVTSTVAPGTAVKTVTSPVDGISYKEYPSKNGWIPVYGKTTTPGISSIVVDFSSQDGTKEYNYTLPVNSDGSFGALLEVPISGTVNVAFVPDFLKELTGGNLQGFYNNVYSVSNVSPTLSLQQRGLLASATMDFNMNSAMAQTASTLMENAPSRDTGIAAIANFVSDKVKYNWPDYQAGTSPWQDSSIVWNNDNGVCQDIAELTASMLKSIGIPTLTIIGKAPAGQQTDDHEWIEVWDGTRWITIDPTWNSPSDPQTVVNDTLTTEYMTMTDSFQVSHTADPSLIGTWQ